MKCGNETPTVEPEFVSVMSGSVDFDNFHKYHEWLTHHVGWQNIDWRVKYLSETGIRTVVIFNNRKHKFMFDIAWAKYVIELSHNMVDRIAN